MKWNGDFDLQGSQLISPIFVGARFVNRASDPASEGAGHVYFNTVSQILRLHDGSSWGALGGGGGGWLGPAASDPDPASEGDVYYNTSTDKLRQYDGSSWADVDTGGVASADIQVVIDRYVPDDTYPTTNITLWDLQEAVSFPTGTNGIVYFSFMTEPAWTFTSDLQFHMAYAMSTTQGAASVKFDLDYWVPANGDTPSSVAPTGSDTETFTPISTGNQYEGRASGLAIANAHVSGQRQLVICRLKRDVSVGGNHNGDFQLIKLTVHQ